MFKKKSKIVTIDTLVDICESVPNSNIIKKEKFKCVSKKNSNLKLDLKCVNNDLLNNKKEVKNKKIKRLNIDQSGDDIKWL